MGEGGKRHRPPPLPVSEIKRHGKNLAEGCKYYKMTLRRMRELKGLPWKGGERAPEDNASEQANAGSLPLGRELCPKGITCATVRDGESLEHPRAIHLLPCFLSLH